MSIACLTAAMAQAQQAVELASRVRYLRSQGCMPEANAHEATMRGCLLDLSFTLDAFVAARPTDRSPPTSAVARERIARELAC